MAASPEEVAQQQGSAEVGAEAFEDGDICMLYQALVVREHSSTDEMQITLRLGDIVNVLEEDETGWGGGYKVIDDEVDPMTGWFPLVCIRKIDPPLKSTPTPAQAQPSQQREQVQEIQPASQPPAQPHAEPQPQTQPQAEAPPPPSAALQQSASTNAGADNSHEGPSSEQRQQDQSQQQFQQQPQQGQQQQQQQQHAQQQSQQQSQQQHPQHQHHQQQLQQEHQCARQQHQQQPQQQHQQAPLAVEAPAMYPDHMCTLASSSTIIVTNDKIFAAAGLRSGESALATSCRSPVRGIRAVATPWSAVHQESAADSSELKQSLQKMETALLVAQDTLASERERGLEQLHCEQQRRFQLERECAALRLALDQERASRRAEAEQHDVLRQQTEVIMSGLRQELVAVRAAHDVLAGNCAGHAARLKHAEQQLDMSRLELSQKVEELAQKAAQCRTLEEARRSEERHRLRVEKDLLDASLRARAMRCSEAEGQEELLARDPEVRHPRASSTAQERPPPGTPSAPHCLAMSPETASSAHIPLGPGPGPGHPALGPPLPNLPMFGAPARPRLDPSEMPRAGSVRAQIRSLESRVSLQSSDGPRQSRRARGCSGSPVRQRSALGASAWSRRSGPLGHMGPDGTPRISAPAAPWSARVSMTSTMDDWGEESQLHPETPLGMLPLRRLAHAQSLSTSVL